MNVEVLNACSDLMTEVNDANRKHGDWSGYTFDEMYRAEDCERMELAEAVLLGNITGPHGVIRETMQVAATLIKRVIQMEKRLKLFCEDGHEWFGECLPAVCPFCKKDAIGAKL